MNTAISEASEIIAQPDVLVSPQEYRRILARLVCELTKWDKFDDVLSIGNFTVCSYPDGGFWIDCHGEGMQTSGEKMEKLIGDFYKAEF